MTNPIPFVYKSYTYSPMNDWHYWVILYGMCARTKLTDVIS